MSIYNHLYSARIAPSSATWREAIRNGVDVVDGGRRWTESFAEDAFLATGKPVPVVLSHDEGKPVGHVAVRIAHGGWHIVDFTLDHSRALSAVALDRLRVGTPVSIGFHPLRHDELLAQDGIKRHTLARLDELSILGPGETPAFRGARITAISELKRTRQPKPKPPNATPFSEADWPKCSRFTYRANGDVEIEHAQRALESAGEQIIHTPPGQVVRRYYETPITIR